MFWTDHDSFSNCSVCVYFVRTRVLCVLWVSRIKIMIFLPCTTRECMKMPFFLNIVFVTHYFLTWGMSLVEVTELYSKRVLGGQIVFMIIVNRFPNFLYLFKTTYALKFAIRVHCPWQYVADLCYWSLLCNCTLQWKAFITTWYHVT